MNIRTRYMNDPLVYSMVNMMLKVMRELQLTPTEMRECAVLACVIERETRAYELHLDMCEKE